MPKKENKNTTEVNKKTRILKICKRILFFLSAGFLLMELFMIYYGLMGQHNEIKNLSEDEIRQIKDTYDLILSDTDEIVSISFMARGIDTFIVLKIKTDSPADFCADNAEAFPEQHELKTVPFFFSTYSYAPWGGIGGADSIYYSKKYVYISSWCHQNKQVKDLYFDIESNRENQ